MTSEVSKTLRVAMITPFFAPNIGGVEVHLNDLCRFLVGKNHRVVVLTYQPLTTKIGGPTKEVSGTLEIRRAWWFGHNWFLRLEPIPLLQTLYSFPGLFIHSLVFLLRNSKRVDVVHTHGFIAALIGRLLMPFFQCRWVTSVHTTYSLPLTSHPWLGRLFSWILNGYDRTLVVSKGCERELSRFGLNENRVKVFTYWADDRQFIPMEKSVCKNWLGWGKKFVVLFVGRLIRIKGADVLVDAAKLLDPSVLFAFITSGTDEEFGRLVNRLDLPSNVLHVGPVPHEKLHVYYNAADLLAVPSQLAEGFARVNLEAMLCGTPVVASNIGYLSEVLRPDVGELVDPPTSDNFAAKILSLAKRDELLSSMSKACVEYARNRFSPQNANVIEEAYRR